MNKLNFNFKKDIISSYSSRSIHEYEAFVNKDFLYGKMTQEFLKKIKFSEEKTVLDMGSGTGFVFDVLKPVFQARKIRGIGVEPAKGMLNIAINKYKENSLFYFMSGSFEKIPLKDKSVDKIISTLSLHWVQDIDIAVKELQRVLKSNGSMDILMIARDDGFEYKRKIISVLKNYLSFSQILKATSMARRLHAEQLNNIFKKYFKGDIKVTNIRKRVYGPVNNYLTLFKARSSAIVSEIKNNEKFFKDFEKSLRESQTKKGVPFDLSLLSLTYKGILYGKRKN